MAISFNNIPTSTRTPGVFIETDNSRALQGLTQNPHTVLIVGTQGSDGTTEVETIKAITRENLAAGFYGPGSILTRMCERFKKVNPNTELHAMALSANGGVQASGMMKFDSGLLVSGTHNLYMLINGVKINPTLASGWSVTDVNSAVKTAINADSTLPIFVSVSASVAGSDHVVLIAQQSGTVGNYIDVRLNYYAGESNPWPWSNSGIAITSLVGGTVDPDLSDVWAVVDGEQYQYVISPYIDAANLANVENEFADRFKPLEGIPGNHWTAVRGTQASCTTLGNSRNSPHGTIMGCHGSPSGPEEWAAALGGIAAAKLNADPARPLHYLKLTGILPPAVEHRFTRTERDILLYDGIATYVVDNGGNVLIERAITTYQTNAAGTVDVSYLDVQTLYTLYEIAFQYKTRMVNRFIIPRFKLADDGAPIQPGSKIATPSIVKLETISLFTELRDQGLIENLDEFVTNLVVERNASNVNRVDVLLPPDLINQFRMFAANLQFLL